MRKKGVGIKIEHNKGILFLMMILLGILIILIYSIVQNKGKETYYFLKDNECIKVKENPEMITFSHYKKLSDCEMLVQNQCEKDSDCVPASCCHPDSCVPTERAPICDTIMCTAVCSSPLDCGAGSCGCVNRRCEVVDNE